MDNPLLWTTPPKKCPSNELVTTNYLLPFKLNYGILRDAVTKAYKCLVASIWTTDEVKQYLWVYGINNDAVELNKDTMIQEYDILKHHKEQYPKRYQQWRYPAAWTRGINIEQHVDVGA